MNGLFSRSRWGQFSTNKALFIIIIWFVFPFVILGKFSFIHTGDNFEFNVAHLMALGIEGLNPGFWNPVTSSGTDTIAIGIVGEINRVLFFYFPGWLAYQLLIVVQTVAAILGSYLFCRYLFKLTSFASILPSIIFGLMIPGQLHFSIIAFLPALILSLSYLLENSRSYRAWGLSLIIFFWVSETAYISWLIPFPSIVLIGWFLFVEKRQSLRQWVIIICFALLLQAFRYEDIVALIQFAPHAHMKLGRTLPSSSDVLAWPPLLRENLVIICIGLFGYSWIVMESRPPIMRGLALFLVVGIVAEPIAVLMQIYLAEQLPFIQGFNVAKITRLFEVIVWLSSAFAVQPILEGLKENGQKRTLSWGAFFFLIAVVLFYGVSQKIDQMRDWVTNVEDTFYIIGTVAGPHPFPAMVRDFQSIIGEEVREQIMAAENRLPDTLVACIGGGSNAMGLFHPFLDDADIDIIAVEAAGRGIETGEHAASLSAGSAGVLHGNRTYLLQDDDGQITEAHSISAGLDYPGIGPEHSWLHDIGRASYVSITDDEALDAFRLTTRLEGIIPALESAHAIAHVMKIAPDLPKDHVIVLNLSGRGDKDLNTVAMASGESFGVE